MFTTGQPGDQNQGYQQGYQQGGYGYQQQNEAKQEDASEEGFLGILKRWFGGGKSKEEKGSGHEMMVRSSPNWVYVRVE